MNIISELFVSSTDHKVLFAAVHPISNGCRAYRRQRCRMFAFVVWNFMSAYSISSWH